MGAQVFHEVEGDRRQACLPRGGARMTATYVLGTHVSHNGSACLLRDGEIIVAIEKERLTRRKHDGGMDNEAIEYCLRSADIRIEEVDLVVQNANFHKFDRPLRGYAYDGRIANRAKRVVSISHHLGHAYSALATAGFDGAGVLVIDGCGNCHSECDDLEGAAMPSLPKGEELGEVLFEKDSYYSWHDGALRTVFKDFSLAGRRQNGEMFPGTTMHSIGGAYLGVSRYVFRGLEDPGKLMGLAPYGRPGALDFEMFDLRDGRVLLRYDWMADFDRPARSHQEFTANFQYYADIAHRCQRELERALLYVVDTRYEMSPSENLCFAGGVALNAVANRRILHESKFENAYFQPAAGDNGLAIGCAYYGWLQVMGGALEKHDGSFYMGRSYGRTEVESAIEADGGLECTPVDAVAETVAGLLHQGKIIAWFCGGSEFGPRALGHRSILAAPAEPETRDKINREIKFREDFRPFAPAVPLEEAARYFDQSAPSPYMILVAQTKPEYRAALGAVVHVDGSARVQTVTRASSPEFHRLLEAYGDLAAHPVLLNTSLNRRGMPIVETPTEAVELLRTTALDALVFVEHGLVVFCRERQVAGVDARSVLAAVWQLARKGSLPRLGASACLDLCVTESEQRCSVDMGRSTVRFHAARDADLTFRLTEERLVEAFENPQGVAAMLREGRIEIVGAPVDMKEQARGEAAQWLTQLLRAARDGAAE